MSNEQAPAKAPAPKQRALVVEKPFILPGIGRMEKSFGMFVPPANYLYRDAVARATEQGYFKVVEVSPKDLSKVRVLTEGMLLNPDQPPPVAVEVPSSLDIPTDKVDVK